jgi:hypothetical protein
MLIAILAFKVGVLISNILDEYCLSKEKCNETLLEVK